jgi:hypothetical protein
MIGYQEARLSGTRDKLVLRLDRPILAFMAALGLGGCFGSRETLIGPAESLKLFGERGQAQRVHIGDFNGPNETLAYSWAGSAYRFTDEDGRADPAQYRLAPFTGPWMLTERLEHGVSVYGLARRESGRLWTYSPQCKDLTDSEIRAAQLDLTLNGTCWIGSAAQLRRAMQLILAHNPRPDGYFELQGAH